jgi:putative SOS response-associated peptidase YedK
MCGRYTLTSPDDLAARFELGALTETHIEPRFNVAPSQGVPVIVAGEGGPGLTMMRWGFQPAWMRTDGQRPPPINARGESLLERPTFRGAVSNGRCLIPADGFYEWQAVPGRKTKQPIYIRLTVGDLFAFAGLYVRGPGEVGDTCVIVTTAANAVLSSIHERMPIVLDLKDELLALRFLRPVAPARFETYPVSSLVSSARNEGPELIEPAEPVETVEAPRLF